VRRTRSRLEKWEARLHIVAGLLIALDRIDRVIEIIRASDDSPAAELALMSELDLSQVQAKHILDMQLRKLTALEAQKLETEADGLEADITAAQKLLASEPRRRTLVLSELRAAVDEHGVERRTEILSDDEFATIDLTVLESNGDEDLPETPSVFTLSTSGMVGRAPTEGAKRATPGRHDLIVAACLGTTRSRIVGVTTDGKARVAHALELNEVGGRSRGTETRRAFGTNKGEEVLTIVVTNPEPTQPEDGAESLVLVTANGVVKRVSADEVATTTSGAKLINLKPNDTVAAAFSAPTGVDIVLVASDAQVLRMAVDQIRVQGRNAAGVTGMKLRGGARIIGAGVVFGDAAIITVTDRCTAKVTAASEFESKGRGGMGVRVTKFTDEQSLSFAYVGSIDGLLAIVGSDDEPNKAAPDPVPIEIETTRRDLVSGATDRPILAVGPSRW